MADVFMQNVGLVRQRLTGIPNGIDLSVGALTRRLPRILGLDTGLRKERVLFVTDVPKDKVLRCNATREGRLRTLAQWKAALERLDVIVDGVLVHEETGAHSTQLPQTAVFLQGGSVGAAQRNITDKPTEAAPHTYESVNLNTFVRDADIIIAATEFSATDPLIHMTTDTGRVVIMRDI